MENKELNELLVQRQKMLDADITDEHFDKLRGLLLSSTIWHTNLFNMYD